VYVDGHKSLVSIVRTKNREEGVLKAVESIGGINPAVQDLEGYIVIKPNCNSHDPYPASTHPRTLRTLLKMLADAGLEKEQIVVGDMSGPAWLPTRATMKKNGILDVAMEFEVRVSFFEEEKWVQVKPEKALSWPEGFRVAETVHNASRVISLPCLKTHQFGGIFTLSLKNSVGVINPADRTLVHKKPGVRIAEINLAYTSDLVVLDGLKCFVSGGPAHGKEVASGIVIAGGDRVAVDAVGVAVLKYFKANGIAGVRVQSHDQLRRAAEIGVGHMYGNSISLRTSNLTDDEEFEDLVKFIRRQL
jgi:uncharacterized protein (DUF362 family)